MTATTQTRHTLTLSTKTTLRHHSPELRHFKGIAAIHIKCLIDWCMIQVRQMVRRHRKNEKRQQKHRQTTYQLTPTQKIALRNESPHLRHSTAIAVIRIRFRVNWCIRQVGDTVRRHRMNKNDGGTTDTTTTYHVNKKPHYDISRQSYATLKLLSRPWSNEESIDVWYRCDKWWEDIERTKSDSKNTGKTTYHSEKKTNS